VYGLAITRSSDINILFYCRDDQTQQQEVVSEMDINEALRRVLKAAIVANGLTRGIREAAKALDKRKAHLCILATNCEEALYIKLVEALCQEHGIPLLKVIFSFRFFCAVISSIRYEI